MIAATVVLILLERQHPIAARMNFLQIVLVIWILSSFSEEVYVRGLVQSWMAGRTEGEAGGVEGGSIFSAAIVSSAVLFASMHVPLMWSPLGVKGGLPLVLATLSVGWACAVLRARSKSLLPAIACHVFANATGIIGGILGVILYWVTYGHLPEFLMRR